MWRYYYMDDHTRTIFYTETDLGEDRPDLIFVGMSQNPNPKMAVAVFTNQELLPKGFKIRPL
jgi:hypothetical protein